MFATHYLEEAQQFAVRNVAINRGKIVVDGATADPRAELDGCTVTATLPWPVNTVTVGAILDALKQGGLLDGLQATDMQIDASGIMRVRTARSDALAAKLLELGAHDLEIVAPTLETVSYTHLDVYKRQVLLALQIYVWLLIASAVLSWLIAFNVINTRNQFVSTVWDSLYRVTEPALRPIRERLPNLGGLDISPIILLLIIFFIQSVIVRYIYPNVF